VTAAIEVECLRKVFGSFVAVDDVSFTVAQGEIFGLLGPNGAGKTTLIRMLTTLLPPTSGTARVAGWDIVRQPERVRQAIGVIPQALTSDPELTAEENLLLHAKLYGVPAHERRQRMEELLAAVDLTRFRNELVRNFSGGMRRRLEVARGLMHRPRILFLDEPTTGLDPASRSHVWEMIHRLRSEHQLTIVLTTHYMEEADRLCDRVAIMDQGALKALDTPARLKASIPGHDIIEGEFDQSPPDWAEALARLDEVVEVQRRDGVFRLLSHNGARTVAALMELARQRQVAVRRVHVQSTSLDDVFLYYTGRALRDEVQRAGFDISYLYR